MANTPPPSDPARTDEVVRIGDHFYVLAVSARADERTRVLKHDDTFGVFNRTGDMLSIGFGDQGLYHLGTRHLSRLDMTLSDQRTLLLSSGLDDDNVTLVVDSTNPDVNIGGDIAIPRGSIHVLRTGIVWAGALFQRFRLRNFHLRRVRLSVLLRFEADFADMFQVRGVRREKHGAVLEPVASDESATLAYRGLDGVSRTTTLTFDPPPTSLAGGRASFDLDLDSGQEVTIDVRVSCTQGGAACPSTRTYTAAVEEAKGRLARLREGQCSITTSSVLFNRWLGRSRSDLHLMLTDTEWGLYPYAGIPWFSTPFGRDGIITALETLWIDPSIARGVLSFLAQTQATELDPPRDAEPGKIMHEFRAGEMPATGEVPYARYYGSIDSTPLFVMLAGEYLKVTGDRDFIASIRPNIARALEWMDQWGDRDGDGLIKYQSATPEGLTNQAWKDSLDSIFFEDGAIAPAPRAVCEVQGYAWAARRAAAEIAETFHEHTTAVELRQRAEALRQAFEDRFWDDELGTYILAVCGEGRPCRVAASNTGHCLYTGIATPEHARRVTDDLLSPRFFNGWGIRTVAEGQARYNPMSYHNGTIWPHDTAIAAAGMARYGHNRSAAHLLDAMFDASVNVELNRLPELFCGFERRRDEGPIRYPVACSPQSWAAGAVFMMIQASLGLEICAERSEVCLRGACLPRCLDLIEINGLKVGLHGRVDLAIERIGPECRVHATRKDEGISVVSRK